MYVCMHAYISSFLHFCIALHCIAQCNALHAWMDGWKDGRMEGRKEGRKEGWKDGWDTESITTVLDVLYWDMNHELKVSST